MVQVDVPMAFAVGAYFAEVAGKKLQDGDPAARRLLHLRNNLFQIFFFGWIPVYFLVNNFGWETTHMWWHEESVASYPLYVAVFIVVFFAAANLGAILGAKLVSSGQRQANRVAFILPVVFSAIWIFAQTPSTLRLGSYAEWKTGNAPWFYEDKMFLFMIIFTLILWAGGLVAFTLMFRRDASASIRT